MQPLIQAEHVSKKFCRSLKRSLWYGIQDVAHSLNPWARQQQESDLVQQTTTADLRRDEFWALQDVNFEVHRGECLGLIGHNGAGKSTLLKILNGLIRPDRGRVTMRGRIGALIELGAGFNPILTGRENIQTQGALIGFSAAEVAKKLDAIIDFAELRDFIDMPLQNYSSGMKVRLGFAVWAQMEPDILLVDEVLAVGDVGFRAKCLDRIGELKKRCAFIFVSHSMAQVTRVATSILHLDHGQEKLQTRDLPAAVNSYYEAFTGAGAKVLANEVTITGCTATSPRGRATLGGVLEADYGDDLCLEIALRFTSTRPSATIQLMFCTQEQTPFMDVVGRDMQRVPLGNADADLTVKTTIPNLDFNSGRYLLNVTVLSDDGFTTLCSVERAIELLIISNNGSCCPILRCTDWHIV